MNFRSFFTLLFEDLSSKLPILLKQFPNENEKSIEQAADADPTPNKKFITWILKLKSINNIILPEDTEKIKETLLDFLKLSNTGKWKADKNIMTYKTYGSLAQTVDSFKDITHIKIDKPLSENDKRIPIKTIGNITVYKIIDKDTLMEWSKEPMKWCTKNDKYAENYLKKGPLYMFFKEDKPYVLCHFETGQIKNQWDSGIDMPVAEELYPFLKNAFKNFKIEEGKDFHVFLKLPEVLEEDKRYILLGKHTVHEDGSVSCEGNVNLVGSELTKLPYTFREVKGNFDCSNNYLTTLEGSPKSLKGSFHCNSNSLTTLKGGPKEVGGNFGCAGNHLLISLIGAPESVGREFNCSHNNRLISLEGAPKSVETFNCSYNYKLTSLIGAPQSVTGHFNCSYNIALTSLEGAPQKVGGYFSCIENESLKTLKGGPKSVGGNFKCYSCHSLTTTEGAPESVGKEFDCSHNNGLISLEGSPKSVGAFNCSFTRLPNLKGAPQELNGSFDCSNNRFLTSLEGGPKEVGNDFYCHSNYKLASLKGAPESVGGDFCYSPIDLLSTEGEPKFVGGNIIHR